MWPSSRLLGTNSFFINSNAGNFEDYIVQDVWSFLVANYPIRPSAKPIFSPACRWAVSPPSTWG